MRADTVFFEEFLFGIGSEDEPVERLPGFQRSRVSFSSDLPKPHYGRLVVVIEDVYSVQTQIFSCYNIKKNR